MCVCVCVHVCACVKICRDMYVYIDRHACIYNIDMFLLGLKVLP